MTIEEAVLAYLLADATVSGLVGDRIFPIQLPQKITSSGSSISTTLPAVTYEIFANEEEHILSGLVGFAETRIQFLCHADTFRAATAVCRAIKNSGIVNFKGITGGVDIRGVRVDSGIRTYAEQPTDGNQTVRYLAELDLTFFHLGD